MSFAERLVDPATRDWITPHELVWLETVFERFGGYPTLEQLWLLMDDAWDSFGCDHERMDERVTAFYAHPVWLLNWLFIEQHDLSLDNRRAFTAWAARQAPLRVADYGGGGGSLARMIGAACPEAMVEVIEPHPHPAAIARAKQTANVRYRPELTGEYDILIATDVFEHVPDPLALVAKTARNLRLGGHYLIANCFWPVIRCHLPQTFHFRHSWDAALAAAGLCPDEHVCYGRVFIRSPNLDLDEARKFEQHSRRLFPLIECLPGRVRRRANQWLFSTRRC